MTVARDAVLESAGFTTTSPHTFVFTPVGTPRAIVVGIVHGSVSTDLITAVTYGGVAMTRVPTNGFAQDTLTEPGATYLYSLGASIPTGAQTVSITHSGSADPKTAYCASATAATDTEIGASGKVQEDAANPSVALDTGANSSLRYAIGYSGVAAPASVVALTGMETLGTTTQHDFGSWIGSFGQQTTASTGSFTIGFTIVSDDVAMCAVAIQEISAAVTKPPRPTVVNFAPTRASNH